MRLAPIVAVFLLLVGFWLPLIAVRSGRKLPAGPLPISRGNLFTQVLALQVFLFALAWLTASRVGIVLFGAPRSPVRSCSAAVVLLVILIASLRFRWSVKTLDEKARLYSMLPHDHRERAMFALVCLVVGVSEECVYRGVLVGVLSWTIKSWIAAVVISAAIFAVSHAIQGWRAVLAVFALSLGMQALVWFARSLIPAMVVHAAYDFAAGILVPRWYEREAVTSTIPLDAAVAPGQ